MELNEKLEKRISELSEEITEQEEYKSFEDAKEAYEQHREAQNLLAHHREIQNKRDSASRRGDEDELEELDNQLQEIEEDLHNLDVVENYHEAAENLDEALAHINEKLSHKIGVDFAVSVTDYRASSQRRS